MGTIRFQTTPKGDIPPYYYILSIPGPFGMELNNVACYRLGDMLYLEIQRGKEEMKTSEFQQETGGTTACTKRLMRSTKECGKLLSNYT